MRRAAVIPTKKKTHENKAKERSRLGEGKSILDEFTRLQTARVRESQKQYQHDRHELLRRKSNRVTSQMDGRNNVDAV